MVARAGAVAKHKARLSEPPQWLPPAPPERNIDRRWRAHEVHTESALPERVAINAEA